MVFAAEGYQKASMEAMAKAAGVTKPVLYQHFPSKLDLLRAVVKQAADDLERTITDALYQDDGALFASAVAALYDFAENSPDQFVLIFETELPQDPEVGHTILEGTARVVRASIPVFQERTSLETEEAAQLAWAVIGLSTSAVRHWRRNNKPIPKEEAADLVVCLVTSGLSKWSGQG